MADLTAYERLLDRLEGVRGTGDRAMARCPAHNDGSPSLSVRAIEGQTLVWCFAGCRAEDILAAVGLGLADLYDEPRGATYRYGDGRLVHRTPDKKFRQSGNTRGPAQLYRLPAVVKAVAEGVTVAIVEGEKDVHALESLGVVATTNPMGATNWSKVDPSPLFGGRIVVVPDRDDAGRRWARDVLASLDGRCQSVTVMQARVGNDPADHVAAGYGLAELEPASLNGTSEHADHRLVLTAASTIKTRRVTWLWNARLALGILALLAGREGLGKSSFGYWLAARVTRGELPGEHHGRPRAVLISATEDSWEHTVVPRLIAAGADLDLVFRVEVRIADTTLGLSLPRDNDEVETAAREKGAALLLLDPIMSRISVALNTNIDPEVRQALEPLTGLADRVGMTVLGIIHLNKTASVDILDRVMGSKAFAAVARAVCAVVPDPDDPTNRARLFGVPKNNLGRDDLPSIRFTIAGTPVLTDDGEISDVGRAVVGDETATTIREAMERNGEDDDVRSQVADAKGWLTEYLTENSHADSRDVKGAGTLAGYSESTLKRARKALRVVITNLSETPRRTVWSLPPDPSRATRARENGITGLTDINAGQSVLDDQGGQTSGASRSGGVMPPREVTRLGAAAPCPTCSESLERRPGPGCLEPVIHKPADLWSTA